MKKNEKEKKTMIYAVPKTLKCHHLTSLLLERLREENPSITPSDTFSQRLYLSIYKIWELKGEKEAERYVREARMR